MRIVEGAVSSWLLAEIHKGTEWDNLPVRCPGEPDDDLTPVLIVPVAQGLVAATRQRIEAALEARS